MLTAQNPLTKTQATRLRNYINASATPEPPLSAAPTVKELAAHPSVTAPLLDALDVAPAMLLTQATLDEMIAIGYGCGHLARSPGFCAQMVAKYGRTPTAAAILRSAQDAVELSASALTVKTLGLSTRTLLDACCGDQASGICVIHNLLQQHRVAAEAEAARAVAATAAAWPPTQTAANNLALLQHKLQVAGPLYGVQPETLTRLGLDGRALLEHFGIPIHELSATLGVPVEKLKILNVFEHPGR